MDMILDFPTGTYVHLRIDGSSSRVEARPNIQDVERVIKADCLDTVILTRAGRVPDIVMMLDDTGMLDNRPVNAKATELYHSVCLPGTIHQIHGDVVLAHDEDFA